MIENVCIARGVVDIGRGQEEEEKKKTVDIDVSVAFSKSYSRHACIN
jgi:hypothetical protein